MKDIVLPKPVAKPFRTRSLHVIALIAAGAALSACGARTTPPGVAAGPDVVMEFNGPESEGVVTNVQAQGPGSPGTPVGGTGDNLLLAPPVPELAQPRRSGPFGFLRRNQPEEPGAPLENETAVPDTVIDDPVGLEASAKPEATAEDLPATTAVASAGPETNLTPTDLEKATLLETETATLALDENVAPTSALAETATLIPAEAAQSDAVKRAGLFGFLRNRQPVPDLDAESAKLATAAPEQDMSGDVIADAGPVQKKTLAV